MFLTENSIQDIFLTGNLKNSALAEEFHKQLHEKYKIQVFVSYYCEETQNSLTLLVRTDDQSTIRVSQNHNLSFHDDEMAESFFRILYPIMERYSISYHRVLPRKQTRKEHHDGIFPIFTTVQIESFDAIGKWHITVNTCHFRAFASVRCEYPSIVKVLPYPTSEGYSHLIIINDLLPQEQQDQIQHRMFSCLQNYDHFHIFTESSYHPVFKCLNDIPPEELSRLQSEIV